MFSYFIKLTCICILGPFMRPIGAEISDKRLCADPKCDVQISVGKTLLNYNSPEPQGLSFAGNVDVKIYSKSAGSNMDLWGAEINGKRGYVPRHLIRESKLLFKGKLEHLVPTETANTMDIENTTINVNQQSPTPDPVNANYEVYKGTTIYDSIDPSTPVNDVQPTEIPNIQQPTPSLKAAVAAAPNLTDDSTNKETEDYMATETKENSVDAQESDAESDTEGEEDEDDEVDIEDENEDGDKNDLTEPVADNVDESIIATSKADKIDSTSKKENTVDQEDAIENGKTAREFLKTFISNEPTTLDENTSSLNTEEEKINSSDNTETKTPEAPGTLDEKAEINLSDLEQPLNVNLNNADSFNENLDNIVENNQTETSENSNENLETDAGNNNEAPKSTEEQFLNEQTFTTNLPYIDETLMSDNNWTIESITPDPGPIEEKIADALQPEEHNVTPDSTEETLKSDSNWTIESLTPDLGTIEDNAADTFEPQLQANEQDEESEDPVSVNNLDEEVPEDENAVTTVEKEIKLNEENTGVENQIEVTVQKEAEEAIQEEQQLETKTEDVPPVPTVQAEDEQISLEKNNSEKDEGEQNVLEAEIVTPAKEDNDGDGDKKSNGLFSSIYGYLFVSNTKDDIEEGEVHGGEDQSKNSVVAEDGENIGDFNEQEKFNDEKRSIFTDDLLSPKQENVLIITAVTVLLFLLGYMIIDQNRKEGPLIAKINKIEKELLVSVQENEILKKRIEEGGESLPEVEAFSEEYVQNLQAELVGAKNTQAALEEQVQTLERELENSTEVGLELNRMLTDILSSQNASETLIANIEQLQKQLFEQQSVINSLNETITARSTENHELMLELDIGNKKVGDLQSELDKMVLNLLKMEEEKEQQQQTLEAEVAALKDQINKRDAETRAQINELNEELVSAKNKLAETERNLEIKKNEFNLLKESAGALNNSEALKSLLEVNAIKAELEQLRHDNQILNDCLRREQDTKSVHEKRVEMAMQEVQSLKAQNDEIDKQKLEALTKLDVLSAYFKGREAELQKELAKQENMWIEKQGEATSTIERIRFMQEELQNSKMQNELLKQEIVSQEIELKSQITVLEKKAHESWLNARQAERRLEDARQEAAQLRNRLTMRERTLNEDKLQNRVQSPLEHNGDLTASPLHMNVVENPSSPPLLFGTQNHLTTSPLPGLPPFLPPPPGVPFMPPPLPGVPPFMPHLPFPSDHRPAPLGRLSSPPLNSRYSPDSRPYSPYDRNSPSPPYDSEYSPSSPNSLPRMYSPYNSRIDERKEYVRPPPLRKSRNTKVSGTLSSGSGNSNESLEKINKHSTLSKV